MIHLFKSIKRQEERGKNFQSPKDVRSTVFSQPFSTISLMIILLLGLFIQASGFDNPMNVMFKCQMPPGDINNLQHWKDTNNCGPACVLMAICYYNNTIPDEQGIRDIDDWLHDNYGIPLSNPPGTIPENYLLGQETTAEHLLGVLNDRGFNDSCSNNGWGIEQIKSEIDKGNLVIALVHTKHLEIYDDPGFSHWVLVIGYDSNNIICNDPGKNSIQPKAFSDTEFSEAFSETGGVVVVVKPLTHGSIQVINYWGRTMCYDNELYQGSTGPWATPYDWDTEYREGDFRTAFRIKNTGTEPIFIEHLVLSIYDSEGNFIRFMKAIGSSSSKIDPNINLEAGDEYRFDEAWASFTQNEIEKYNIVAEALIDGVWYKLQNKDYQSLGREQVGMTVTVTAFPLVIKKISSPAENGENIWEVKTSYYPDGTGKLEASYELQNISSQTVNILELYLTVFQSGVSKIMSIPDSEDNIITNVSLEPGGSLSFPPPESEENSVSAAAASDMAYYNFSNSEGGIYDVIAKINVDGQTVDMVSQDLNVIGYPVLTSIQITGWPVVSENSGTQYTCTAHYADGSATNVNGAADWTLEGAINASINNSGYLTTYEITSNDDCRIRAGYGGMYDLFNVTIENSGSNLQAPYNLTASKGAYTDHIEINWTIASNTDKVSIERKRDDESWTGLGWTDTLTSHTDTNFLHTGSIYYYRVRAHNETTGDLSPYSNEDSGYLKEPTADEKTPQNVTATNDSANFIQLACDWMADIDGWKVYRSESPDGTYTLIKTYDDNTGFVYNDYTAEPGIYYYYKLTSYGSFGESPPCSPVGGSKLLHMGGISPSNGSPGDTVTIIHAESPPDYPFGLGANQGTLYFGAAPAVVISWSNEQVTATVPEGSGTVEVTLTSPAGIASINSMPFTFNSTSTVTLQPGPGEGKDIWTTSVYSYAPGGGGPGGGLDNHELRVGGWGDLYYSLIEFDLTTLPAAPAISAKLYLYSMADQGTPTEMYLDRITEFWDWDRDDRLWWADRPPAVQWGNILPAAERNAWYNIDITDLFNAWQDGTYPNYGIQLRPVNNNDNWNYFYSSDYMDDPSLRPRLVIEFAGHDLASIGITGPEEVEENSGAQYNCTAYYSDGSTADITGAATWSVDSSYAAVNNSGYLTTSSVPSDQPCRISVTYTEGGITKSGYRDITIFKPKITVITPNGGESFNVNSTLTVSWETAGTVDFVKIEYSTDNGSNWVTEADSVINENSYTWTIPGNPSQNCLIRISNASGGVPSDESDNVFSIVPESSNGSFERVSINSDGVTQGDGPSQYPSISGDGRYITFASQAGTLVDEGGNGSYQVFVHDRDTGQTELVSRALDGGLGNGTSNNPSISSDGRYVAFQSNSSNLVTGYGSYQGNYHIYLHDRQLNQTTLVTVSLSGGYPGSPSSFPMISPDGSYIVFDSESDELVPGDTNPQGDVFCYDRTTGQIQQISSPQNAGTWQIAMFGAISSGGHCVVFMSNIKYVPTVTNDRMHIYLYDRQTNQFELISASSDGTQADQSSYTPSISADGNYVAFDSSAAALVPEGGNGNDQVFLRDRNNNQIELISKAPDGSLGNGNSSDAVISADGRYVTFKSLATNLAAGDTNGKEDIFVYDKQTLEITRMSVFPDGTQPNGDSRSPAISGDGSIVGFDSDAGNLVSGDTNGVWDVFVRPLSIPVPETYTLTVQSTPETGIPITVIPDDNNGNGDGNTIFSRTYNTDTIVTLTAPSSHNSKDFVKWTIDGQDDTNPTIQVTMNTNHTVEAYYAEPTSIILLSPNGGENWEVGSTQEITWTTTGAVGNVKIDYSIDNGVNWTNVITSTANDGLYSWTIPDTPSSQCLIRICDIGLNYCDTSDAVFSIIEPPTITVTSPNGGENWEAGSTYNVTWTSSGLTENVTLDLYKGGAFDSNIGTADVNLSPFPWTIPVDLEPGSDYTVRIYQGTVEDYSDNPFTISSPPIEEPEIKITHDTTEIPDGGSFNFGDAAVGDPVDETFTIENTGNADLILSNLPISITGNNADQFSVIQQPTTPLTPGGISTFIIRFAPSSEGTKTAAISLDNNDPDENPYEITLNGTGTENIIPAIERSALIALYNSTAGDNWTDNSGWKTEPLHTDGFAMPGTEGTWKGITVTNISGDMHVTHVELSSNNLSGNIPAQLGNLSNLTHLYLGDNHFSGSLPSELGNLFNLKNLSLQSNMFTGEIPTSFTNLTDLEYLDIGYNALYTDDTALKDFLDEKDPDWETTQTIAPPDITVTPVTCDSIQLNWTPIIYTQDQGSYKVSLRTESEEEYTYYDETVDKTASSITVTGLTQSTTYYFIIQTCTEPHSQNKNTVCSEPGNEVSGSTPLCPPSITVNSPNGGETWEVGSTQTITWSAVNIEGNVIIEYSTDGGYPWQSITTTSVDDGSYNWTVRDTPSENCLVRISSGTSDDSPSDTSDEVFSIVSPSSANITVTSPNGGESWEIGSIHEITWTSFGFSGEIKIEYSIDNRYSWTTIVTSTDNDGSYNWIVPNNPSGNCFIRISRSDADDDISDVSNAAFSIVPASSPIVTVISPNGGEHLTVGTLYNITWASSENFNDAAIEFSGDNGTTWTDVMVSTPNDGIFEWTVPDSPSESCLIRISDTNGETSDVSDAVFSIVPPSNETITITSPNGGESWEIGSSHEITWTGSETIENIIIEYSTDNGSSWRGVVSAAPNDGSYEWTIPDTPSEECLVRISGGTSDEAPSDTSDTVFSITSAAALTLTAPNGEEILSPGKNFLIQWKSDQWIEYVKLEYSPDNGSTYLTIEDDVPNSGRYVWRIPHHISSNCLVRISDADAMKTSPHSFLYEFKFKVIESESPPNGGKAFSIWLSDKTNEALNYPIPKISFIRESDGNNYIQFEGIIKKIYTQPGLWQSLDVLIHQETPSASLWLNNKIIFENIPLIPGSVFVPAISFSVGDEGSGGVQIDDFAIRVLNAVELSNRFNTVFAEDFERYEVGEFREHDGWERNVVESKKENQGVYFEETSPDALIDLDFVSCRKVLKLQPGKENQIIVVKYFNIPGYFPFDISDKQFSIVHNQDMETVSPDKKKK